MYYHYKRILFFFFLPTFLCSAQEQIEVDSPDGKIKFTIGLVDNSLRYNVFFNEERIIEDSELKISFGDQRIFSGKLGVSGNKIKEVTEEYTLKVGKSSKIISQYNEVVIAIKEATGLKRKIGLMVRLFNDGLGFRYEFPAQKNWKSMEIIEEESSFNLSGNPVVYTLFREHYRTSHEGLYAIMPYNEIKNDTLMDMPTLFEYPNDTYLAITEGNLRDSAGMYLIKNSGILTSKLSPREGQTRIKVLAELPHKSPWRVLMIGKGIGSLLESNILTNLNEPSQIEDTSWIKPGKTTFHWWNGDILPDSTIVPGINFETNKYYIDFAAKNNIEYHAVIGYGGFAWYKSDAASYGIVGPNTDVTQPVSSLDMTEVCEYARAKGVGINVWVNWNAIYPDLEKAFSQFEAWGVKGMMVDFMDRDDQEMINIQEEILKIAAEHKLYIQFHGSFKPTGLHRTYPNEFTREGSYNYENNKWNDIPVSPNHDLNIVFTRMLAGATDYHLGGFRAVNEDEFKIQFTRPLMIGTRCHMLAMYVVMESYLNMVADYPEAYDQQPGFDFIRDVPTTWDEISVPKAEVGEYVCIARRKDDNWYVGSLNNDKDRQVELPLKFLSAGKYEAIIYSDGPNVSQDPNNIFKETRIVDNKKTIKINLAKNGGHVIKLIKVK